MSLINDILDLSKIEAGKISLDENDFDLHNLLRDVEEMFALKTKQKGIELSIRPAPDTPQFIYADEGKLRQVLINLIGNAVKFTERGGVKLRVRPFCRDGYATNTQKNVQTQWLYFEVEDTGPGIAPDEVEKLFVPFEQTSAGRAAKQGTGLGLSLSHSFIQLMGGKIFLSSTVGVGSCFQFELPIRQSLTPVKGSVRSKDRVIGLAASQPDYKILIAEDLPESRQLLSELLTSVGFSVREASNGREALEIWQEFAPHLIGMGLRMAPMDGYEAVGRIRAMEKEQFGLGTKSPAPRSRVVIIALTASANTEERERISQSGFDGYVFKPFKESVIWSTLTQYLGVEFIYQEQQTNITPRLEGKNEPLVSLTSEALSEMPSQWLRELYLASSELEGKLVLELIAEIEPERADLARQLRDLAQNYQFERIIELIPHN